MYHRTPSSYAEDRPSDMNRGEFTRRVLIVTSIAVLAVAFGASFALAYDIYLLVFLAVLLAILLRTASDALARQLGIGPGWSLGIVILALIVLTAGTIYALWSIMVAQFEQLSVTLPKAIAEARDHLRQYEWGRNAINHTPSAEKLMSGGPDNVASHLSTFFSTTLGVLGNLIVLAITTIYLAANPKTYVNGILLLVPPRHRPRSAQVITVVGSHLRWWLIGRLVAMAAVSVITAVGLWIAGIPQSLVLSLVAGLLTAIPYLGAIVSAIPAILLALTIGPTAVLWTMVIYSLAHFVEGYLLTPLIQQNAVELPPVLTVVALALVGALFGFIGLVVATPLAATILVLVKMLYVEDVLGEPIKVPGEESATATV